jgi:hypothetical protein
MTGVFDGLAGCCSTVVIRVSMVIVVPVRAVTP